MPALRLSVALVVPGQPCTMWISSRESVVSEVPTGASLTRAPSACTTLTFLSDPELLSDDSLAVSSPRLSPDQCRIVYLQYPSLIPHHQCSQLCLVSWRWAVAGRGEGQPRLPTSPSWMQGWCESFLSSQSRAWRRSAGMGGFALSRRTALRAFFVNKNAPPFASPLHMAGSARGWGVVGSYSLSPCPRRALVKVRGPSRHLVQITRKQIGQALPVLWLTITFSCSMTGIPGSPRWW